MAWVKRNLGLVIGGVVALALMGLAGYYLWTKIEEEKAVTLELEEANRRFNTLLRRPVHPGNEQVDNIERAREEVERLKLLLTDVRKQVGTSEPPKKVSNQEFRALLDNTVTELQRDADRLGITLPAKDYWFTFSPQKTAVEFNAVEALMQQLTEIKSLTEILYDAKIHDLISLKRVAVATEDKNSTDFLGDKKPATNEVAIVTPYEITFQGFSSELANVLEGFINARQCFVVRSVGVEKASAASQSGMDGMQPQFPNYPTGYPGSRYGNRYAPPQAYYPQAQAARRPGNVLLDENKLRFVVMVDAVRLKPEPEQQGGMAQTMPGQYMEQMPQ